MQKLSSVFLIFLSICFTAGAQMDSDISKKDQRLFNKAIKAYANQKFEKALVLIDESMESDDLKELGTASLLEANILFALNDLENAKSSYLKAIQLSKPGDRVISIAQIGLARSMIKLNKAKEAEFEKNTDDSLENSTEKEGDNSTAKVAFAMIEQVPIYPGCESGKTNAEYKSCMQKAIQAHVATNFNTNVSGPVGLKGRIIISVQFKISISGEIIDVFAKALNPILEEEAIRVIERLPKMKPGIQKGKPVNVIYGLPIIFNVN